MLDTHDRFATEALVPGFVAPELPADFSISAAVRAADRKSRHWSSTHDGKLQPGSDIHKREVGRMFRETFNPYKPSVIAWPPLSADALQRVRSLPIWDIAVQTEGKARLRMAAYAGSIDDADMKAAIALNAWEEDRHKNVISKLVQTYGIPLASEPPYQHPPDAEWAYLVTGYSECIDSFFAFGLFEMARRSGFFPAELVETFEPVMQDEPHSPLRQLGGMAPCELALVAPGVFRVPGCSCMDFSCVGENGHGPQHGCGRQRDAPR
jgi:hypothetical protein